MFKGKRNRFSKLENIKRSLNKTYSKNNFKNKHSIEKIMPDDVENIINSEGFKNAVIKLSRETFYVTFHNIKSVTSWAFIAVFALTCWAFKDLNGSVESLNRSITKYGTAIEIIDFSVKQYANNVKELKQFAQNTATQTQLNKTALNKLINEKLIINRKKSY